MTDDYFYIEEISPNSSEIESEKQNAEKKCIKGKENKFPPADKKVQEIRLHEIEQQLEMAESRCNTLKGQVDYMKMLYNGMNSKENVSNVKTKAIKFAQSPGNQRHLSIDSGIKRKRIVHDRDDTKDKKYSEEQPSRDRDIEQYQAVTHRDCGDRIEHVKDRNQRLISTAEPGIRIDRNAPYEKDANAAVKSINNIICGITNSVNRLTQLQVQIGQSNTNNTVVNDAVGVQNIKCSSRYDEQTAEKPYQTDSNEIDKKLSTDSMKYKSAKKSKSLRVKTSSKQSMCSNENKKRVKITAKHIEKKTKINQGSSEASQLIVNRFKKRQFGKLRTISSRTLLMKKSMNYEKTTKPNPKSEIPEWKSDKLIELYHNSNAKIVTASEVSIANKKVSSKCAESKQRIMQPLTEPMPQPCEKMVVEPHSVINQQSMYRPPLSPINEQANHYAGSYCTKNYELPTIASKMKQVAKSYFQNFSFKTIPFVAARSVTPSHNLGLNIQQVLSIIKGRKPVAGISPTLAYNIELAANKLGSRPLSALVSNLGSRMSTNRNSCPLARKYPFSHLQEMAKEIPEETIEEINAAYEEDNMKIPQSHVLAAGDKDAEAQEKMWYAESKKSEKCTCLSKQGVSFNDVYSKYIVNEKPQTRVPVKRVRYKPWNENRRIKQIPLTEMFQYPNTKESENIQINKREGTLKEVLRNLHDEFAQLNERYEELKLEVSGKESNSTIILDIEKMEKDLQNKEDEIAMVMSLYNEVAALKQQVKVLKTRASQSTVVVSPLINRTRDYKDLNAAGHLTKLLRHIQQFQETLKYKASR